MTTVLRARRALASAAVVAALGGGAVVMSTPVAAAPPAPDGYVTVVDDTGTISVAVPADWDVRTGGFGVDGGVIPGIEASPGFAPPTCDGCHEAADLPHFSVLASPYRELSTGESCESPAEIPFDNGSFVGVRRNGVGCDAAIDEIEASEVGHALNVTVTLVYSSVGMAEPPVLTIDEAQVVFDVMLDSLRWTGSPYPSSPPTAPPVFPFDDFRAVPQLGTEPVLGTGCGADGSVGDVIPDGIWAGFVDEPVPGAPMSVDLLCIFTPQAAAGVLAEGTATMLNDDPNYLVVNNNQRERVVQPAPDLQLRDAVAGPDGGCVEGPFMGELDHAGFQAWIIIEGGQATAVIWGCDWFEAEASAAGAPTPQAPAPTPTIPPATPPPTAAPAPAGDTEAELLQADCAVIVNTIWEGDAFVGVEYPADGEPFTDSLRQAIEYTRDAFTYEVSQVQSQLAQDSFAQYYAEWDSLLQSGIYTSTNIQAVTEAGWFALAPLQNACGLAG